MLPLQECLRPVLSVTLTAKEHMSYCIFWSSQLDVQVCIQGNCGLRKGLWDSHAALGARAGLARGRREKVMMKMMMMMTEGRAHKQEEESMSFHSQTYLCVQTGEGENSVPTAFCVF